MDVEVIVFLMIILLIIIIVLSYLNSGVDTNNNNNKKETSVTSTADSISFTETSVLNDLNPINKSLNPMIVLPGLGGTNLDFSINDEFNQTDCSSESLNAINKVQPGLWINPVGLLLQRDCFLDLLKPVYNKNSKTLNNVSGLGVFPKEKYFGDPLSSICLAYLLNSNEKCYPFTDYSKNFAEYFVNKGYTIGYNLFIPGYDFRLIPYKNHTTIFFDNLKKLIENTYKNTNKRIHLIGHSLGTLLSNMFLNKMSKHWKSKYIADFISISPSYDGAPKSLRTALSGYNFGLPNFINVTNEEFTLAERNIAGVAATIPLLPEMYGEVCTIDNKYFAGNGTAVTLLINGKGVTYNVNDYKDGIIGLIRNLVKDINKYAGANANTQYLDTLTDIMIPIVEEKKKYAYKDPGVKVYQIIAGPVSTEVSYLYEASKGFSQNPIFTLDVIGDEDVPVYGTKIPNVYGWKDVTNKIFPPINNLNHFTIYTNSTAAYDYIYSIVKPTLNTN